MGVTLFRKAKTWAKCLKRDVMALWLAARDRRVPWHAKLAAGIVAAYALSPIALIPDFIPILGYVDDLLIVPLGFLLAIKLVPKELMEEFRTRAEGQVRQSSRTGLIAILAIWTACLVSLGIWFTRTSAQ